MEGDSWVNVGNGVILIADCDSHTFNSTDQLKLRHKNRAIGINKSGEIVEINGDMTAAKENSGKKEKLDRNSEDDKNKKEDDDKPWKYDNYTDRGQRYLKNGKHDDD